MCLIFLAHMAHPMDDNYVDVISWNTLYVSKRHRASYVLYHILYSSFFVISCADYINLCQDCQDSVISKVVRFYYL